MSVKRVSELMRPELLDKASDGGSFIDLLDEEPEPTGPAQNLMLSKPVTAVYERWWRPALGRLAKGVFGPSMTGERQIARLLLALRPGDLVLDVACGTGSFTRDLASVVGSEGLAVGLDVSLPMLERAVAETKKQGAENVALVRASATELPFKGSSFDAVCCFAAIHLFEDPMAALDEMREMLKPGGRIAILASVMSRTRVLGAIESALGEKSGMYMFDESELREELADRGFTDIRQKITGFMQFIGGRLPG